MDTGTPSTATWSRSGSTRCPRTATEPLTVTRPSSMSSSHARRLPKPARASTFCSRSPSAVTRRSLAGHSPITRRSLAGSQPLFEDLDHLRPGHEVAERGKVVEGVEAETLEELARGAVEHGLARAGIASHLLDVAAL